MSIFNFIAFTIVASFVVVEQVQTTASSDFTLEQYLGKWFQVGILLPEAFNLEIMCERFNARLQQDCDRCFVENYRNLSDGQSSSINYGIGRVLDSEINVSYPRSGNDPCVYTVISYNNGRELVLYDRKTEKNSKLLSRNGTFSIESQAELDQIAENAGQQAVYVNANKCK